MKKFREYISEATDVIDIKFDQLPSDIQDVLKKIYVHKYISKIQESEMYHVTINRMDLDKKDLARLVKTKSFASIMKVPTDKTAKLMFEKE